MFWNAKKKAFYVKFWKHFEEVIIDHVEDINKKKIKLVDKSIVYWQTNTGGPDNVGITWNNDYQNKYYKL